MHNSSITEKTMRRQENQSYCLKSRVLLCTQESWFSQKVFKYFTHLDGSTEETWSVPRQNNALGVRQERFATYPRVNRAEITLIINYPIAMFFTSLATIFLRPFIGKILLTKEAFFCQENPYVRFFSPWHNLGLKEESLSSGNALSELSVFNYLSCYHPGTWQVKSFSNQNQGGY